MSAINSRLRAGHVVNYKLRKQDEQNKEDASEKKTPVTPNFMYNPPANLKDFEKPETLIAWSEKIAAYFRSSINGGEIDGEIVSALGTKWSHEIKSPQAYAEIDKPTTEPSKKATIPWNAFPNSITQKYGSINTPALEEADIVHTPTKDVPSSRPQQDEYCEWFVTKKEGKITKIEITAESPEYYDFLYNHDQNTLLNLYHNHVSQEVVIEDLEVIDDKGKKVYNPINKWNTTHGIMHLNSPPNTLSAEIYLGVSATVLRKHKDGTIMTDAEELIRAALYGRSTRNSDPNIGARVNEICQDPAGYRVTLKNPVALYIHKADSDGFQDPHKKPLKPIERYFKCIRGDASNNMGLRYCFEVPDDGKDTFVLGDCFVDGKPLNYGGQVAKKFTIALTGLACKAEDGIQPAVLPEYTIVGASSALIIQWNDDGLKQRAELDPKNTKKSLEDALNNNPKATQEITGRNTISIWSFPSEADVNSAIQLLTSITAPTKWCRMSIGNPDVLRAFLLTQWNNAPLIEQPWTSIFNIR